MKTNQHLGRVILTIIITLLSTHLLSKDRTYHMIDLGTFGGLDSDARGINASGQVVGTARLENRTTHAFLYDSGLMQDLGTLGGKESIAHGINSNGDIVGASEVIKDGSVLVSAFLYKNSSMKNLGDLGKGHSYAYSINDLGDIVGGFSVTGQLTGRAFLYQNSSIRDIGIPSRNPAIAHGINNKGQIVGYSNNMIGTTNPRHAFIYSNGLMKDIDRSLFGQGHSWALGINDAGLIVGTSVHDAHILRHAFLYINDSMHYLGTLGGKESVAQGINNNNQIVGASQNSHGAMHAFLYEKGEMIDLNDLVIDKPSNCILEQANAINDNGQIVGYALITSDRIRAFLLNPLPIVKDKLILVTHGWNPGDAKWLDAMTNNICQYLAKQNLFDWQVIGYKWIDNATTCLLPFCAQKALDKGRLEGQILGDCITTQTWAHVHLIAHSAGAALIQAVSEKIKAVSPTTTVHCTFLDPFVGFDYAGISSYGKGADWAENYFSRDNLTRISGLFAKGPFTESLLTHTYNIDVTELDPNEITVTSHGWPCTFYNNSILGSLDINYAGFGFPLSREGGGWNLHSGYIAGNNPGRILGGTNPTHVIQTSGNLVDWVDLVKDKTSNNVSMKFYRKISLDLKKD